MKAMGEAERSIAIKRRIAVTRPISREDSPSEVYTPKRRKSETGKVEVSPPPYIPSKKESSSSRSRRQTQEDVHRSSSKDDVRYLLERREQSRVLLPAKKRTELISRSRRIELLEKLGIDREERLRDKQRKDSDRDKETSKRSESEMLTEVRNFKITAQIAPSSRSNETMKERLAKALEDKDGSLKVTVLPSSSSAKGSIASRLGKVVIQRRRSFECERDEKEVDLKDTEKPTVTLSSKGRRLALSLLGKEVVKRQCEAAVLSVKSANTRKFEETESRDSRVVENHSSSDDERPEMREKSPVEIIATRRDSISIKSERDSGDKDSEDLDDMLKDDLEPDLLQDSFTDEFTLDLEDEDLIKVVGQLDEEDKVAWSDKSEHKSGTRFIVTLDGVDERQFEGSQESTYPNYLPLTPTQSVLPSTSPLVSPIPVPQGQAVFLQPQNPLSAATPPVKAAPPKIQPFSINLKDSDDEFEEKADHKIFSTLTVFPQPTQQTVVGQSPVVGTSEGLTSLQKAKLSERCKFWPACAAGSECEFHHPTSYCKTFPNCKFGDKCLFIHPNCKFDSKCTRIDCPFTHTSRRPVLGAPPQAFKPPTPKASSYYPQYIPFNNTSSSTVCKFFPNCQNINCPFIHPKPCRFGISCQNPSCPFSHPTTPSKDKLKWTASSDQQQLSKEGLTTLPAVIPTNKSLVLKAVSAGCAADSSTSM